jgi:asparagine synthase (glutamine-hydrolysing)
VKVHRRRTQYITKWLLRQSMTDRLPRQLLHRPKRSLPNPLSHWLRGPGSDFLDEQVDAICECDSDLFMPSVVRRLADEHRTGAKSHGLRLWTLILFRLWRGML